MNYLDSDEYDWQQRLSHTNMTVGGGFMMATLVTIDLFPMVTDRVVVRIMVWIRLES